MKSTRSEETRTSVLDDYLVEPKVSMLAKSLTRNGKDCVIPIHGSAQPILVDGAGHYTSNVIPLPPSQLHRPTAARRRWRPWSRRAKMEMSQPVHELWPKLRPVFFEKLRAHCEFPSSVNRNQLEAS